jgi:hypothetical protein
MSVNFLLSEWGEETIKLEISLIDASPDGDDENVYCAKIHDQDIYFEAHVDSNVQTILQAAVDAIKDFIEIDPI